MWLDYTLNPNCYLNPGHAWEPVDAQPFSLSEEYPAGMILDCYMKLGHS